MPEPAAGPYRLIVTGPRSWRDWVTVAWHLSAAIAEGRAAGRKVVVVHGDCPEGVDSIAERLCRKFGVETERNPADWRGLGKRAGFARNAGMVAKGAEKCLHFAGPCIRADHAHMPPHDSHGAAHCAETARRGGIEVRRIEGQ